jgi:hypothetical protein
MMHGQTQIKSCEYCVSLGSYGNVTNRLRIPFWFIRSFFFLFSFNCSLAIVSVFHYLIAFWFSSYTLGTASVLFQTVIVFVALLSLSSYDSSKMMTAEALIKTNKALPNFRIFVCYLLSMHVTRYCSESKLPLTFKGIWRWLISRRLRPNSHYVSEARSIYVFRWEAESEEFCLRGVLELASLKPWIDPGSETNAVWWNHHAVFFVIWFPPEDGERSNIETLWFINLSLSVTLFSNWCTQRKKNLELLKHIKIMEVAPTRFGLQRNNHREPQTVLS